MEQDQPREEVQIMRVIEKTKAGLTDWIGRILIALLAYMAVKIYEKVDGINASLPVLQMRVENLERKLERMENKVFLDPRFQGQYSGELKKEDDITLPQNHK